MISTDIARRAGLSVMAELLVILRYTNALITVKMRAVHTPVGKLPKSDFEVFAPKIDFFTPNFTQSVQRWGVHGNPRTENFMQFRNINATLWCIPCAIFMKCSAFGLSVHGRLAVRI